MEANIFFVGKFIEWKEKEYTRRQTIHVMRRKVTNSTTLIKVYCFAVCCCAPAKATTRVLHPPQKHKRCRTYDTEMFIQKTYVPARRTRAARCILQSVLPFLNEFLFNLNVFKFFNFVTKTLNSAHLLTNWTPNLC